MKNYDQWRLSGPDEHPDIGMLVGDECSRVTPPDEDAPRGYRPKPCQGTMIEDDGLIFCHICGELA